MGGEVGKQPQLCTGQAHRPGAGRPGGRRQALAKLAGLLDERAQVRAELEHALGLAENGAGGARVGECEVGACELEPDFDGPPREAVVEQRSQTVDARQRRSRLVAPALVECDPRRRSVHDCAARVVTETLLVDDRLCRPCAFGGLAPRPLFRSAEREQCLGQGDVVARGAEGLRRRYRSLQILGRAIGCAEQRVRNPSHTERAGDPPTSRWQLIERQIRVGERTFDTVPHHVRAQDCDPRLDRGAAIRQRACRSRPVCESQQPLCIVGPPGQYAEPRSVDGEYRMLHQLVLAEPLQPLARGLHPAVEVERQHEAFEQVGDGARLARRLPVDDRFLRQAVGDAPRHRATVQLGQQVRLAPLELVAQELAEQVVVAIPLAPPVKSYDEAVRALERVECVCRPSRLEHRIAERTRQALQHRRVLEEGCVRGWQAREKLDTEVVGHELVDAAEARISPRACRPLLHRQRCEVQTRRPPFRLLGQVGQLARDRARLRQLPAATRPPARRSRRSADADLLDMPVRPPAGKRQCRLLPAGDRDLRAGRNVLDEFRDHVQTRSD